MTIATKAFMRFFSILWQSDARPKARLPQAGVVDDGCPCVERTRMSWNPQDFLATSVKCCESFTFPMLDNGYVYARQLGCRFIVLRTTGLG